LDGASADYSVLGVISLIESRFTALLNKPLLNQDAGTIKMKKTARAMKACTKFNGRMPEYFFDEGCFISELSNSCDDSDVSIARARLKPGKKTRWHYLRGTGEGYAVLGGAGLVEVDDLKPNHVSAGDVVLILPEVPQRITNTGAIDLVFLAICSPRFTEAVYVDIEDKIAHRR